DTAGDPTGAYFSPFTRAWELALGALVAVGTPWILRVPRRLAAVATWVGLGAVLAAAVAFGSGTPYPGSLVAIPVGGAALLIAGGVGAPRHGAEVLLRLPPFRLLGRLSYSLYLWHWPILILAAEHGGSAAPAFPSSLVWIVVALAASVATYVVVENPIRHSARLVRLRWASVGLGAALIGVGVGAVTIESAAALGAGLGVAGAAPAPSHPGTDHDGASLPEVLHLVAASNRIRSVVAGLDPPLSQAVLEPPSSSPYPPRACTGSGTGGGLGACSFGDVHAAADHTLVLYGDSHAGMWFHPLDAIASRAGWRLVVLYLGGCPPSLYPYEGVFPGFQQQSCLPFHRFALRTIRDLGPAVVVVSQERNSVLRPAQWNRGLRKVLDDIDTPGTEKIVLGNIPLSGGPACLAAHQDDVPACDGTVLQSYNTAERRAAAAAGARYIDVTPWFCAQRCSPIVGTFDVYFNTLHVAAGYTMFLEGVLASAVALPSS
ncbi:MAG TPA: acyltransferase family protein, partial [Acidimicrobiales bacterium]|nr:acyltransferase family protein [Acidimicrobiales bacterium]